MRTPRTLPLLASILVLSASFIAARAQTTGSFQNAGLTLHYTIAGKGTPVVMLSGGPGMDAAYMQPVADIVARDHTAILLDQRGTTGSMPTTLDASTISPALYISDLEALRTSLDYKEWIVLGHSAGSLTAMSYAIAHPDHAQALVLLATVPPRASTLAHMDENIAARLSSEIMQQIAAIGGTPATDKNMATELRLLFPAYFFDHAAGQRFVSTISPENSHAETSNLLQGNLGTYDLTVGLAKLHIPTIIIQGRQDPLDPEMAAETRGAIPGSKLVILERAGHFSWLENLADFTTALSDFLKPLH